ncbi:MAG: hypothetical protein GC137_07540 [Alphaproteobacteria bacterium]|nr:hypothetical protein [Alphaproteobacteria bacterium]
MVLSQKIQKNYDHRVCRKMVSLSERLKAYGQRSKKCLQDIPSCVRLWVSESRQRISPAYRRFLAQLRTRFAKILPYFTGSYSINLTPSANRAEQMHSLQETLRPYFIPTLILCVGLALSVMGFVYTLEKSMKDRQEQFMDYALAEEIAIKQLFSNYLEDMELSQHFFKTSSWVTKEEFATFIVPLKKRGNFSLFARIDYDNKQETLSIIQAHIANNDFDKENIKSILSEVNVVKGLRQAKAEESLIVTDTFTLGSEQGRHLGIAFPYFKNSQGVENRTIDGFVLGVLNLRSIFSEGLKWEENSKNVSTYVYADNTPVFIPSNHAADLGPGIPNVPSINTIETLYPFYHKTTLPLANKSWEIYFVPTTRYLVSASTMLPWVTLFAGILLTSVIGLFTFYLTTRNLEISRIVQERTRDLERAMKRLSRSNIELERFAYVASHDLKEPLRLISNFTTILYDEYRSKFDKDGKEYVDIIVSETGHMQDLIKGLLEYAQTDKMKEIPRQQANCQKLLKRVLSNLSLKIKETGATITHDEMPVVVGYNIPLVQLFQNLIGNALKYNRNPNPAVHIGCIDEGKMWHFTVKDNGIGIKEENFARVFEPFKRLHRKDEFEGTGIGLAICKKTIDNLGGKLWLESVYGQGSTFHFTIPKVQKEEQDSDPYT